MKKQKTVQLSEKDFDLKSYSEYATLNQLQQWINEVKELGAVDFNISVDIPYGETYADSITLEPYTEREETDQEYQNRLWIEEQNAITEKERLRRNEEYTKTREIETLKALKAKYPNI